MKKIAIVTSILLVAMIGGIVGMLRSSSSVTQVVPVEHTINPETTPSVAEPVKISTPSVQETPKSVPPTPKPTTPQVPTTAYYTAADVRTHATSSSCWTIVNGKVYDVTSWISRHPGGSSTIKRMCGTDGSGEFNDQHGGNRRPEQELASFYIGILKK